MFQGTGNDFCNSVSSEIPSVSPASQIFVYPPATNSLSLLLKSPVFPVLLSRDGGSPWGWGRGSSSALLLPEPSLCWETGKESSQLTSRVPDSACLLSPHFPQLNDAYIQMQIFNFASFGS